MKNVQDLEFSASSVDSLCIANTRFRQKVQNASYNSRQKVALLFIRPETNFKSANQQKLNQDLTQIFNFHILGNYSKEASFLLFDPSPIL